MMSPATSSSATGKQPLFLQSFKHQSGAATRCGHELHPSASEHTPWCPGCVASQCKAKLEVAQKGLAAEGGLAPPEYMRDRMWNRARLKYNIAKLRMEQGRKKDQLRWERERIWDEAHKRYDSEGPQDLGGSCQSLECPVCASLVLSYQVQVLKKDIAREVVWWEQPGALVVEHAPVPRTPVKQRKKQAREPAHRIDASETLRETIKDFRRSMKAAEAQSRAWQERHTTERAIRHKYGLEHNFPINANLRKMLLSTSWSSQNHQQSRQARRAAERRARGSKLRPIPPRSSLFRSELAEDTEIDEARMMMEIEREKKEELDKEAKKVAKEVGYLYFVGGIDGLKDWREDVLRSDNQLVVRTLVPSSDTSGSESSDDSADGYSDESDGEGGYEGMDIDGP